MNTSDLFSWLLNSGGLIVILSWVVERWPWYQGLSADAKKAVFIAGVIILGLGVYALQLYVPVNIWTLIDPWVNRAAGLFVLGAGAMGLHALTKPQ